MYHISSDIFTIPVLLEQGDVASFESTLGGEEFMKKFTCSLDNMPILPLRNMMAFPNQSFPIPIGRESSLKLVRQAEKRHESIMLVMQKDPDIENPSLADLYSVGVQAQVMKVLELPDGSNTALVVTTRKLRLNKIVKKKPYLRGIVEEIPEALGTPNDPEFAAIIVNIEEVFHNILEKFENDSTNEMKFAMRQIKSVVERVNFIMMHAPIDMESKQKLLEVDGEKNRFMALLKELTEALQLIELKASIQMKTQNELSQQQREHFLSQQLRSIQDELGGGQESQDFQNLEQRASLMKWPEAAAKVFRRELEKLERLNANNPEYSVQYAYLETFLSLPWDHLKETNENHSYAEKVLDRDHYGLEEVKERILESIAVMRLRRDMKAPILCLYGPPGVGKTSLGKSIAEALGRDYARVSLGGLHDESEIRGHRRTYIGAMPGRVIKALTKCGSNNPVIVLDEIDKVGQDFKGDPSTALLEVLDPEQNHKFHDNYIDADYDLSKVFFIATANNLQGISRPLLDHMELIEIPGYTTEEKIEIAKRHLIPKEMEAHGLPTEIKFDKRAIAYIIDRYTRESGVRELDKKIAKIMRKIAYLIISYQDYPTKINKDDVVRLLGKEEVSPDMYENNDSIGVVTGLAWTQVGGEILFVESSLAPGKGDQLTLTGNLGDVMKESAILARQYLKSHHEELGIDIEKFNKNDIHIHVPEGAIPKDGPSAGITMVTSLASTFTGRKVRPKLAMTGEITLRGKVLPVGGIKEKILAAKRAGISDIILCRQNKKDIDAIKQTYLKGLTFHYVEKISEVLQLALI